MTPNEAKTFFRKAFTAFPGLQSWLNENSPDIAGTLSAWAKTLATVEFNQAVEVLDGWIDGSIKDPPTGYKRETFAINVKAIVARQNEDSHKEIAREEQWRKSNRGRYQPSEAFRSVAKPFFEILKLRAEVMAGRLDSNACEVEVDRIVEQAFL
jgi:hypothetical protein